MSALGVVALLLPKRVDGVAWLCRAPHKPFTVMYDAKRPLFFAASPKTQIFLFLELHLHPSLSHRFVLRHHRPQPGELGQRNMSARRRSNAGGGDRGGRRSSLGVAASPAASPAVPQRRLGLRARDSGAFDLGLLQLDSEEKEDIQVADGDGGVPLFALDEEEGQNVKASHILGSVFVFALFSMLCYLMLWNVNTVSKDFTNPLITRHGRNGTSSTKGVGVPAGVGVDGAMLQDWASDQVVKALIEEALLKRMNEQDAKNAEFQQGLWNVTQLIENVAKKSELYTDTGAAAGTVEASNVRSKTEYILQEIELLKAQIAAGEEEDERRLRHSEEERNTVMMERYEEQKQSAEMEVKKLQEKVKILEAAIQLDKNQTALMEEKLASLAYNMSSYEHTTSDQVQVLGAAVRELQMEEKEEMLKEARATVEDMVKDLTAHPLVLATEQALEARKAAASEEFNLLIKNYDEARMDMAELAAQTVTRIEEIRALGAFSLPTASKIEAKEGEEVEEEEGGEESKGAEAAALTGDTMRELKEARESAKRAAETIAAQKEELSVDIELAKNVRAELAAALTAAAAAGADGAAGTCSGGGGGNEWSEEMLAKIQWLEALEVENEQARINTQHNLEMFEELKMGLLRIEAEREADGRIPGAARGAEDGAAVGAVVAAAAGRALTEENALAIVRDEIEKAEERIKTLIMVMEKEGGGAATVPPGRPTFQELEGLMESRIGPLETSVRRVKEDLRLLYADNTDMIDYAADASGGKIVPHLSSATYSSPHQLVATDVLHSFGANAHIGKRDGVIKPGAKTLGDCWPLQGRSGSLTVQLKTPLNISHVSVEHVARSVTKYPGTAPRSFRVLGRKSTHVAEQPLLLHSQKNFVYDIYSERLVQTFALDRGLDGGKEEGEEEGFGVVTLEVLDNWGNNDYTCLYRLRVHGVPVGQEEGGFGEVLEEGGVEVVVEEGQQPLAHQQHHQ